MKLRSVIFAVLLAVTVLVLVAVSLYVTPSLRVLGWDPVGGFLFSSVPLLRLASLMSLAGSCLAAAGALLVLRKRLGGR